MPEIYNQNESSLVAIVPGLVLETIIEHISFAFLLLSGLVTNSHATALNPNERQMEPEFLVGGSIVSHNVRFCGQGTKEGMVVGVWDEFIDELHGSWDFLAVFVEFHVVELKVEDVPLTTIN